MFDRPPSLTASFFRGGYAVRDTVPRPAPFAGARQSMASSAVSDSSESFADSSETTAVSHSTGDTVHLRSPSGAKHHFVGRITRMWVDEMDEEMCECAWYFRHSDIAVGAGSIQPLGKDEVRLFIRAHANACPPRGPPAPRVRPQ